MTTARDIMTANAACAHTSDSLVDVARKMRDLSVGALPICGEDDRLQGVITDRDIVINCVANGGDPNSIMVEEYAAGEAITIGADDSVEETLRTMTEHGVRRLPVIDGDELVGIVSQADVAMHLSASQVAELVGAISQAPGNNPG
jgi:CBS domain-containing protein